MTEISKKYAYHHLVSFKKFENSIDRVLEDMWKKLGGKPEMNLVPILIGLVIDYKGDELDLPAYRGFLNRLITLREKNFIRFVVDTQWAMESDNGYIFYTKDGIKEDYCDVIWAISPMADEQVEVGVHVPARNPCHALIAEMSKNLKYTVPSLKGPTTSDQMVDIMKNFFHKTKKVSHLKHLQEDFHIILVPTKTRNGFHPIPIYGMSHFDAKRHYRQVTQQLDRRLYNHYELFTFVPSPDDVLYTLLGLIQDNDRFGIDSNLIKETYALAELVFGMWATYGECDISNHDIMLFQIINRSSRTTHVYNLSMHDFRS